MRREQQVLLQQQDQVQKNHDLQFWEKEFLETFSIDFVKQKRLNQTNILTKLQFLFQDGGRSTLGSNFKLMPVLVLLIALTSYKTLILVTNTMNCFAPTMK